MYFCATFFTIISTTQSLKKDDIIIIINYDTDTRELLVYKKLKLKHKVIINNNKWIRG